MTTSPAIRTRHSPDGRFRLDITPISNGEGRWSYLDISVFRESDNTLIGKTSRNYSSDYILQFLKQDGKDYLIISENYHGGYGVMDLSTGEKAIFDPTLTRKDKHEQFWCWAGLYGHDADTKQLRISGCYWAAPYDIITYDFSNPMQVPYPILNIEDEPYEDDFDDDETSN